MFQWLLQDMSLYQHFILMQLRTQTQYKINLAIDIITYFAVTGLEFIALLLFFVPFPTLLGWKVGEVALLASIASIGFGLAEMVGAGIDGFDEIIKRGGFDQMLLRPAGAFLQVIGSDFRLRRLGRITQGVTGMTIALHLLPGLHWTADKFLVLLLGMLSGAGVFISIQLLGATLCFWTVETTELTSLLYYGGREMMSYPITIYSQLMQSFFLFVVPVAFGTYIPACYILGHPLPFNLPGGLAFVSPLIALAFLLIAGMVWRFGVHHYQSTGS